MADPMLQVREAEVRFGELRAVRAVDLDLAAGERLALLGPSGCGKSSLLRALSMRSSSSSETILTVCSRC